MHDGRPHERNASGNRGADAEAPIGILIEAHDLSGEGHAEGTEEQDDSREPCELARVLVGAEQEHLRHVREHQGEHEVGAPAVQRAQVPAERLRVVQVEEALPCGIRRRHVHEREARARDQLQQEHDERRAAEHVPPARRAPRHGMRRHLREGCAEPHTLVEPRPDRPCPVDECHVLPRLRPLAAQASGPDRPGSTVVHSRSCTRTDRARAAVDRTPVGHRRRRRRHDTGT